ncbi:uncharacterized protein LOC144063805 [Vanacampus margaritifer]
MIGRFCYVQELDPKNADTAETSAVKATSGGSIEGQGCKGNSNHGGEEVVPFLEEEEDPNEAGTTNDVVLLASSSRDLQLSLELFAAECEAVEMKISTSKSQTMVLSQKSVECPLRVGDEILPQVEEFKYLGVLFTSEARLEREIDRRIGAASAVMQTLYRSVVVKKELS